MKYPVGPVSAVVVRGTAVVARPLSRRRRCTPPGRDVSTEKRGERRIVR